MHDKGKSVRDTIACVREFHWTGKFYRTDTRFSLKETKNTRISLQPKSSTLQILQQKVLQTVSMIIIIILDLQYIKPKIADLFDGIDPQKMLLGETAKNSE